ncbi:MAG TPA: hypothetical protein PK906_09165 [Spirochaetota bacterium]|nr:hypothetical protein [Spirochaetota bacterium]
MNRWRKMLTVIITASSALFICSCSSYPQLITSQYVDKPVIIGPYWKIGSKLDNYSSIKEQYGVKVFETEVERVLTVTTQQQGNYQTTNTYSSGIHSDNISRDILMQNPTDEELILIKQCYIGAYLMYAPGGAIQKTFGGVEGMIITKPSKGK